MPHSPPPSTRPFFIALMIQLEHIRGAQELLSHTNSLQLKHLMRCCQITKAASLHFSKRLWEHSRLFLLFWRQIFVVASSGFFFKKKYWKGDLKSERGVRESAMPQTKEKAQFYFLAYFFLRLKELIAFQKQKRKLVFPKTKLDPF